MTIRDHLWPGGDLHSLAAPYALDALEPQERARFERHLERCQSCAAEVRALSEDAVRLAWSTAAPPPPMMRDRVMAAVRNIPQEGALPAQEARWDYGGASEQARAREGVRVERPQQRPREPRFRWLLMPLATTTAAAALVVAALFAVQADRARQDLDAERVQAQRIAQVLAAPDASATSQRDAQGRGLGVVASKSEGRAVVTLSGLGTPSGGRVHQLWLMRPNVQPRSLGLFTGDTPLVASGLSTDATSLAVTEEPNGGSPQPTSAPVVQLALNSVGFGG
ncbi:anti-sigma factor [Streptomyces cavernae]|uniref:anti-sigma factor n=1 Tax=Streptomyces cavernae TaxID=2259034 RepID=UPI000FEBA2E8|nr:anti-sigma factor [Streptomyces cavernae]